MIMLLLNFIVTCFIGSYLYTSSLTAKKNISLTGFLKLSIPAFLDSPALNLNCDIWSCVMTYSIGLDIKKFFSSSVTKKKSVTSDTFLIDEETSEGGSDIVLVSPV